MYVFSYDWLLDLGGTDPAIMALKMFVLLMMAAMPQFCVAYFANSSSKVQGVQQSFSLHR